MKYKKSPAIIFKVLNYNKASLNNKSKKSRDFYYKNGDWINYIIRPDAVFNLDISDEEISELNKLRKGNNSQKNEYSKRLEKLNSTFKTTGLYGSEGVMSIEDVKNLKKRMRKIEDDQIIWDTVVSFSGDFVKNNKLYTPEKVQKAINEEIKKFFEDNNLCHDKMDWFFAMHLNTDNNHIHLGFFEKEPTDYEFVTSKNGEKVLNKYGKLLKRKVWHRQGSLNEGKNLFKANIEFNIYKQSLDNKIFIESQNNVRKNFGEKVDNLYINELPEWSEAKQVFVDLSKSNFDIVDKVDNLTKELKELFLLQFGNFKNIPIKKIGYGSKFLGDAQRKKIDELTMSFINSDPELKTEYDKFIEENNKRAEEFGRIYANYELDEIDNEDRDFVLTPIDLLKEEGDWNLKDPVERIKYQKLSYKNEHIKSKNRKGYYQGLLPSFGNKILKKIMWNWKKEEWNNKLKTNRMFTKNWNPDGYKNKKRFISQILYLPSGISQMINKEKNKAKKTARNINKAIEEQKYLMKKEMELK